MREVITDFNKRVDEINKYFVLLSQIVDDNAELFFRNENNYKLIDNELHKILKANGFLLLYNLIESSIKSSMTTIFDSITQEQIPYKELRPEFKRAWIEFRYLNFQNKNPDDVCIELKNMSDLISFSFEQMKIISGNLDSKKIKELAEKYGFSSITDSSTRDGCELVIVKNKRNALAHGNISFSECGREYHLNDLLRIKEHVINYLDNIIKNIEQYLINKEYKERA
ncbi:MAG: MAE_28990/MAE_18760 family HEPN-like nuclease [Cyanobacteriota bacterium]